ncbi:MAG: hypothetical protein ABFD75_12110 [Smithella sp.]
MNIKNFLIETDQTINSFAEDHNIPATTVWRAVKGKTVRPINALLISKATDNRVTTDELLYPDATSQGANK